jgi:anti-anti-sigma regulatory factor
MKSEYLDISLQDYDKNILLVTLRGKFYGEQIPNIKEKFELLVTEGNKNFIVDLQDVSLRSEKIPAFFVDLLNKLNGHGGRLIILSGREDTNLFFFRFRNILEMYRSISDFEASGFIKTLRRGGMYYSRKTGIRVSSGMAFVLILLIGGWLLTLFSIVQSQRVQLQDQNKIIAEIDLQRTRLEHKLIEFKQKLGPLKDLGIIQDTLAEGSFQYISDWIAYLELLEGRRPVEAPAPVELP